MNKKLILIKQEIERLKHTDIAYDRSRFMLLLQIEDFIDSLPEESSEDLEEEILNKWEDDPHTLWPKCPYGDFKNIAYHFAEWQKQQMMKDAVETTIVNDWQYGKDTDYSVIPAIHQRTDGFNVNNKVKIIIVKED